MRQEQTTKHVKILAIRDGWSEERAHSSRSEALMVASAMWDSGRYELVTAYTPGFTLFYRRKHCMNIKQSRKKVPLQKCQAKPGFSGVFLTHSY